MFKGVTWDAAVREDGKLNDRSLTHLAIQIPHTNTADRAFTVRLHPPLSLHAHFHFYSIQLPLILLIFRSPITI